MAQNKVQYQRGLPMLEFFELYGSHERCEDAIRGWRWPEGFVCPRCQGNWHSKFRRQDRLYFQCSACRYQCSVLSGTIFESSKLALPKWFLAMHLMTQAKNNISALELNRHLDVSYPTALLVKHKLMEVMVLREQGRQLTGRIEADYAYLGDQRPGASAAGARRTRSPSTPRCRPPNRGKLSSCACRVVHSPRSRSRNSPRHRWPHRPSWSRTGWVASRQCAAWASCTSSTSPTVVPPAPSIRRSRGNLKTALAGTYHAFSFEKYAHRYLGQVQYLFNRRFDLRSILARLARAASQAKPSPLRAIRAAELPC